MPLISGIWGFTKIRGTILRVPILRTRVFWGLYWVPLILGNYHIASIILGTQVPFKPNSVIKRYWALWVRPSASGRESVNPAILGI